MKKTILFSLFAICLLTAIRAQESPATEKKVLLDLAAQVLTYPQEKIYLQTDRPCYVNGEKVFFRAFLLHAALNRPFLRSRYLYLELIDPLGEVTLRLQVRPSEEGLFHGAMTLPEGIPEGYYRIRAYTRYMENCGEPWFFSRTIFVAHPNTAKTEIGYEFSGKEVVSARFRFRDRVTGKDRTPKKVVLLTGGGKTTTAEEGTGGWFHARFNSGERRVVLLEYDDESLSFKKYISLPPREGSPEVTFYPEGGSLVAGKPNRIAFKALMPDGNPAEIEGVVYDSKGEAQASFSSFHAGMGDFTVTPQAEEHYHAQCTFKGETIRFELPAVRSDATALQVVREGKRLRVSVRGTSPAGAYLLAHRQGVPILFEGWESSPEGKEYATEVCGPGVTHWMLLNKELRPLSERMVFDPGEPEPVEVQMEKKTYRQRELVTLNLSIPGTAGDSIPASLCLSVTDDRDIRPDTTTNIRAEILLVSELEGHISHPAWYFGNHPEAARAADLLMLTHGWRNYFVAEALQGTPERPATGFEQSQSLSGHLKTLAGRAAKGGVVKMTVVAPGFPSEAVGVEDDGYFLFDGFEFPDSTTYQLHANSKERKPDVVIHPIRPLFPKVEIFSPPAETRVSLPDENAFAEYISKADRRYLTENGTREVDLPEVTVRGTRRIKKRIHNQTPVISDIWVSPEDIEKDPPVDFNDLLFRLGRGQLIPDAESSLPIVVNGLPFDGSFKDFQSMYRVEDIAQVEYFSDPAKIKILQAQFAFTTWPPGYWRYKEENKDFQTLLQPLGYLQPVEFYSPRYDTDAARNDPSPDLRTTIYWKPGIAAGKGEKTSVEFYTADGNSTYSMLLEGVGSNRQLIYYRANALIRVK